MSKPWGYHALIDVHGCDKGAITDEQVIKGFVKNLVDTIDMKAFGEPILQNFANDDPTKGGYTLVQLIETSNICAHFVEATGDAYFDIFSCKEFQVKDVIPVINKYFHPEDGFVKFVYRDAHESYEVEWDA